MKQESPFIVQSSFEAERREIVGSDIDISVVVPLYNVAAYVERCIQALLTQNYPANRYEIIAIDNNSTDGSASIVGKYPRVKLLSEPKQGPYAARNCGVLACRGRIIAFTDPDCVPAADWLKQIQDAMKRPEVDIVVGSHELAKQSMVVRILEAYENEKNRYVFNTAKKQLYFGHTNNMAVRASVFSETGPFLEIERGADTILVRRCVEAHSCDCVVYLPGMRVRHMEVDSARKYFHKVFTYGRSLQTYGAIADARSITNRERIFVFRKTVERQHYSWTQSAILLTLLSTGFLYWVSGCIGAAAGQRKRVRL